MPTFPIVPKQTSSPVPLRVAVALIFVGIAWRSLRYALRFPVWGDEAMLCLNLLHHDFSGLLQDLRFGQIAPILFLEAERLVLVVLGPSELSLRILPFLAGVAALGLFGRLTRRLLELWPATIATGVLAASVWPVAMCTQAKPYSFDLFWSLALLVPAVEWLRRPDQRRWLAILTLTVGVALTASYPAAFVAGSVSLALTRAAWRTPASRRWILAYHAAMLSAFAGNYLFIARNHLAANGTGQGMEIYWQNNFPPPSLYRLPEWLYRAHTGSMFSYPMAGPGFSAWVACLVVVGIAAWWRRCQRAPLLLLAAPFALNFIAAALHRYPYSVPRLSQHLAPSIIVLASVGVEAVLKLRGDGVWVRRCALTGCAALALVALRGTIRDIRLPGADQGLIWMHEMVQDTRTRAAGQPLVLVHELDSLDCVFRWYFETQKNHVACAPDINLNQLTIAGNDVWSFHYTSEATTTLRTSIRGGGGWRVVERFQNGKATLPTASRDPASVPCCELCHWVRISPP